MIEVEMVLEHLERDGENCSIWRQEGKEGVFWMSSTSLRWRNRKERDRLFFEVQRDSTKDTCQRPKGPLIPQQER